MKTKFAFILLINILWGYTALSQQPVTLTIKVNSISVKKKSPQQAKHLVNAAFKFYKDSVLGPNLLTKGGCFSIKTLKDSIFEFNDSIPKLSGIISDSMAINPAVDTLLKLCMENYDKVSGDICTYKKGDELHLITSTTINLNSLKPGLYGDTLWLRSGIFSACIQILYSLGSPAPIATSADTLRVNNVNAVYSFKSGIYVRNTDSLKYVWEFSVDDSKTWQILSDTGKANLSVLPQRDIFKSTLKKPTLVNIRFSIKTSQVASSYVFKTVTFTPPAPILDTAQIKVQHSCPDKKSGIVTINNVLGTTGSYRFFLRKGKNNFKNCAEDMQKPCPEAIVKSFFSDSFFVIENVPAGDFTLIVLNDGFNVGDNYSWANVSVPEYPRLRVSSKKIKPANCSSGNKGSILLTMAGNNASELNIQLFPANNLQMNAYGDTVFIPNLNPGTYSVKFTDDCSQVDTAYNLIVPEDSRNTVATVSMVKKPGSDILNDGVVNIHVSDGPSLFSYRISKNNIPVLFDSTNVNDVIVDKLGAGKYTFSIADALNRTCAGFDTVLSIQQDEDSGVVKNIQYNIFDSAVQNMPFYNSYLIVINKTDYVLKLYKNKLCTATLPVTFGNGDLSVKLTSGDFKTPEGLYTIIGKSTDSKLDRYFILDYPTKENYITFNKLKVADAIPADAVISDKISLHGTTENADFLIDQRQNFTNGSIALKNKDIEMLYDILPPGTKVLILNR